MSPLGGSSGGVMRRVPPLQPSDPDPEPQEPGVWSLLVNPSFNPVKGARRLRNGQLFTSTMDDIYDGLIDYWVNGAGLNSAPEKEWRFNYIFIDSASSYQVGRNGFKLVMPLYLFFRLTGDIRLLDEMCRLGKLIYANMWRPNHPDRGSNGWLSGTSTTRTYHGERTWVSTLAGAVYGHDDHLSDTPQSFRTVAPIALALQQNRHLSSPDNHNYGEEADKWLAVFQGYERVWSTAGNNYYPPSARVPQEYTGYFRGTEFGGGGYRRAVVNEFPYNSRSGTHSNHTCAVLSWYVGQILGKPEAGALGYDKLMGLFYDKEIYYVGSGSSEKAIYHRAYQSLTTNEAYAMPVTYQEYGFLDMLEMYMAGDPLGSVTEMPRFFRGTVRAHVDWVFSGAPTGSFTVQPSILGTSPRTGTNLQGSTRTLNTACAVDGAFCGILSKNTWGGYTNHVLIPWDNTGTYSEYCFEAWKRYSNNGSVTQPENLSYPLGLFIKEANLFQ